MDLSSNNLEHIPVVLPQLSLRRVNLGSNQIKSMAYFIPYLFENTVSLNLEDNTMNEDIETNTLVEQVAESAKDRVKFLRYFI